MERKKNDLHDRVKRKRAVYSYIYKMKQQNRIALKQIGQYLNDLRMQRGIGATDIQAKTGLSQRIITNILTGADNYSFVDFLNVCHLLEVHLEFSDLREKSNFDMLPDNEKPNNN